MKEASVGSMSRAMTRRQALALGAMGLSGVLSPPPSVAQTTKTVGALWPLAPQEIRGPVAAFHDGLRALGYVEGRTVRFVTRYAEEQAALAASAMNLLSHRPDVVVTVGEGSARAVSDAGAGMPIVMAASADPVGARLAMSLARPGGNVTGMSMTAADLAAKRFALLRRAFPTVLRVAILWNATDPLKRLDLTQTQAAASTVGMTVLPIGIYGPDEIESAFDDMVKGGADALITLTDEMIMSRRDRIVAQAATSRLPALYERRDFVDAGGLMFYGPSLDDLFRRAAGYVDRILKGARPGDLPFEPPTKFDLVLNGTAAKGLGIVIPPPVLKEAEILP